eukprot:CAMPEP_0198283400 /NCGR_PEP_ID=MMETSP1449-20131203/2997_1 /TAXON_ID=420275 /ORGANISM="Attheya septentrionalis, Strain CCMP2084" /LENGTH=577 /DNA_ID=CAMNT_0043979985 /DNA_START=22 /DNA_END=1755 /DNA_ORIENTATION=-
MMRRVGRQYRSWTLVLFGLVFRLVQIGAQEQPSALYQTENFNTDVMFRQSVCDLHEQYDAGNRSLENALEGLELRVVVGTNQYFQLTNGTIDEDYPGLTARLLDELAGRGKFTWRNSFAVSTFVPTENKTWTELLKWTTDTYDVSATWWAQSVDRLALGVSYPEGWYDASIIMVSKKNSDSSKFDPWSWLDPFASGVWIMIGVTIIFSGLVYWFLERIDHKSDKRSLHNSPLESIFLAGILFTSHFLFHPRTHAARLFSLSLAFWALLTGAAYTANLASFLVVQNSPKISISSVDAAVKMNVRICIFESTQADEAFTKAYPLYTNIIRKQEEEEIFLGVASGECTVAVTTVSSWRFWERNVDINDNCHMDWIGRIFMFVSAGFATTSDSGTLCTSLIRDVLNFHFGKMKEEGVLELLWEDHLKRTATIDCQYDTLPAGGEDSSSQLDLSNMGGIFIFHFALSILAIIVALIRKVYDEKKKRDVTLDDPPKMDAKFSNEVVEREEREHSDEWSEDGSVEEAEDAQNYAAMKQDLFRLTSQQKNQAETVEDMNNNISTVVQMLNERKQNRSSDALFFDE